MNLQHNTHHEQAAYQIEIHSHAIRYTDAAGELLAEVTFPEVAPSVVEINHTFVDERLRGQGIAGKLLEQAVEELRETGRKARPTCSYAAGWFAKHPECSGVLA